MTPIIPPAAHHPISSDRKGGPMHPWLAANEVAYREAERHRDADGQRLAKRAHRSPARRTPARARLGALLVRAGEALGAPTGAAEATPGVTGGGREVAC